MRLHFGAFIDKRGWTQIGPAGQPKEMIGAHTRLAAHAVGETIVEVVALTDSGRLALYRFDFNGTDWKAANRRVLDNPPILTGPPAPVPAGALTQPANNFRINPLTDLAILRRSGDTACTVFCAGLRGGVSRTLMRDPAGNWLYFV